MKLLKQSLALLLIVSPAIVTTPLGYAYQIDTSSAQAPIQDAHQTPGQLQQLVAPIALYPDALVAQILAASTYPTEVVEADRWIQQHPELKGKELGKEVDKQPWDPSVKALAQFPSVLGNMDKNLSWTSSLGDAYVNQQNDVMDSVQVMRERAQKAGNLKSTSQQTVAAKGQTIVIEPADPTWCMFQLTIRGWSSEDRSSRGRDGTRIPESGLAAPTPRSVSALELGSSAALAGDGITGDSIGTTGL